MTNNVKMASLNIKLNEIATITQASTMVETPDWHTRVIAGIEISDLMSEVLLTEYAGLLLITSLISDQTIRTAHMIDCSAILYPSNKTISSTALILAHQLKMCVLVSPFSKFECCYKLSLFLEGKSERGI